MPAYTQQTWADGSAGGTPINAARLNHMEDGISNSATDEDLASAVTSLTTLANAKVPATRTLNGVDLSVNRTFVLSSWNAAQADLSLGNHKLINVLTATADGDATNLAQVTDMVGDKLDATTTAMQTLLGGKIPCIVVYDDAGSSWHASSYTTQAADANRFFFFMFGVDDGLHDPFATAGGSAWVLFQET